MTMMNTAKTDRAPDSAKQADELLVMESARLFGANRVVIIKHQGELYRLSVTKQGKLILTK
jgi:hemin uptake protein HemP